MRRRAAIHPISIFADPWRITPENGFLIWPEPRPPLTPRDLPTVGDDIFALEYAAHTLPIWLANGQIHAEIAQLPLLDLGDLSALNGHTLERLHLLYALLSSAYIHALPRPQPILPAQLAVPLTQLSNYLERPPIFAYAGMVLANWRRLAPGPLNLDTLDVPLTLTGLDDERWFFRIHAAIEARGGGVLAAIQQAIDGAIDGDDKRVMDGLRAIRRGLVDIVRIFNRMPEACDPDIYYQRVRPYLFGFTHVIYEGVSIQPQTWRGGSGAQSSIVPSVLAALGVYHQQSELTEHLAGMRPYMPKPHRAFIDSLNNSPIRAYAARQLLLRDAYNHCLRALMTFRRAHLYYAKTYIFEKSTNPMGTGGTQFMDFLNQLIAETQAHLLP